MSHIWKPHGTLTEDGRVLYRCVVCEVEGYRTFGKAVRLQPKYKSKEWRTCEGAMRRRQKIKELSYAKRD